LVGAIAIPVLAHDPGWGRGRHMMGDWGNRPGYSHESGRGYDRMTEDQRNHLDQLNKSFYDETAKLRSQLWDKPGELDTLLNSLNPDVDKAKALQKDISELRTKLDQVRINFTPKLFSPA
jgi:Spy/CpxP family protein refolding chaperone